MISDLATISINISQLPVYNILDDYRVLKCTYLEYLPW